MAVTIWTTPESCTLFVNPQNDQAFTSYTVWHSATGIWPEASTKPEQCHPIIQNISSPYLPIFLQHVGSHIQPRWACFNQRGTKLNGEKDCQSSSLHWPCKFYAQILNLQLALSSSTEEVDVDVLNSPVNSPTHSLSVRLKYYIVGSWQDSHSFIGLVFDSSSNEHWNNISGFSSHILPSKSIFYFHHQRLQNWYRYRPIQSLGWK